MQPWMADAATVAGLARIDLRPGAAHAALEVPIGGRKAPLAAGQNAQVRAQSTGRSRPAAASRRPAAAWPAPRAAIVCCKNLARGRARAAAASPRRSASLAGSTRPTGNRSLGRSCTCPAGTGRWACPSTASTGTTLSTAWGFATTGPIAARSYANVRHRPHRRRPRSARNRRAERRSSPGSRRCGHRPEKRPPSRPSPRPCWRPSAGRRS